MLIFASQSLFGGGVFIFNQSTSHPESQAKALRYNSFKRQNEITTFVLESGEKMRITMFQPLVILPDVDPEAAPSLTANDAAAFVRMLADYQVAAQKYPNAKPLLLTQIAKIEAVITNLKGGKEWFDGAWMDRVEAAQLRSQREAELNKKQQDDALRKRNQSIDLDLTDGRRKLAEAQRTLRNLSDDQDRLKRQEKEAALAATDATGLFEQLLKK